MSRTIPMMASVAMIALTLSACGGGDDSVASIPPPPASSPPPSSGPLKPPHLGLVSSAPFVVVGTGTTFSFEANAPSGTTIVAPEYEPVSFSYDRSSDTYQISLPQSEPGTLVQTQLNGSAGQIATSTFSHVSLGSTGTVQPVSVTLQVPGGTFSPYTYTSWGNWRSQLGATAGGIPIYGEGYFAYGIPTAAGLVPTSGTGTYAADIHGQSSLHPGYYVTGPVSLSFDFGAGTLSGWMHPGINDDWGGIVEDYGQYDFTQTVYSSGSGSYSGKFIVPGIAAGTASSGFEGYFTGPGASELLGRFVAPVLDHGQQGTIAGIWIGKKN